MNLFSWFVIGHLVGDWLLQNDWMAKGKKTGLITLPGMTHFVIYTAAIMTTLLLSAERNQDGSYYLLCLLVVFVSHWLIDASDLVGAWNRLLRQTDGAMMRIMVDQSFHLIVLAGLAAIAT